jgi:hypothetical protein
MTNIEARLALARAADSGVLDSLECPDCGCHTVSIWFSHPREDEYRTWFICSECAFNMRGQNLDRPRHYSEERVDPEFEMYDDRILGQAIFKKPKPRK